MKVHRATGIVPSTIGRGLRELEAEESEPGEHGGRRRVRRVGGGRKLKEVSDPSVLVDLESLVEPDTRGDPESPLRWTIKSLRQLAGEHLSLIHIPSPRD